MTIARCLAALATLTLAAAWASVASAQPAASLEDLKPFAGDTKVTVVDVQSRRLQGTIADASESLLLLRIGSEIRRLDVADIRSIGMRKEDSVLNGTLLGAAIGGGATSLLFLDNECRDDPVCYKAVAAYAGLGAAVGLGIDALIHGTEIIYGTPSRSGRALRAVPLAAHGRRGIGLVLRF